MISCANIIMPGGGPKDTDPPQLNSVNQSISKEGESRIVYEFDERIEFHESGQNFYISPPLKKISKKIKSNALEIIISDSISEKLLYYISLNNCIKDVSEGNVLERCFDSISPFSKKDSIVSFYSLNIHIRNAYDLKAEQNHWILLYHHTVPDSLIFKTTPNYIAKTNYLGKSMFNNLVKGKYKIVSLSGSDYFYHEDEIISFSENIIVAGEDTSMVLFTFNPMEGIDSLNVLSDTSKEGGSLNVKSNFSGPCIIQLLNNNTVIMQDCVNSASNFNFKNINVGEYTVKIFVDENNNGFWDSGSFKDKKHPEKVFIYPEKITIRSNWDLELEWEIIQ